MNQTGNTKLKVSDTGIRVGELVSLRLNSVDWQNGLLTVEGKTGSRVVPVSRKTLRVLRSYIDSRRKARDPNEVHVFLTKTGWGLTLEGVKPSIRCLCVAAGIESRGKSSIPSTPSSR